MWGSGPAVSWADRSWGSVELHDAVGLPGFGSLRRMHDGYYSPTSACSLMTPTYALLPAINQRNDLWFVNCGSCHQHMHQYQRYQQRADGREQRLLQLYAEQRAQQERAFQRVGGGGAGAGRRGANGGSAGSSSSSSVSSQSSLPPGKVRQLFEGRRQQGVGRDRGQPLAPLDKRAGRSPATRSTSNVNLSQSYHFGQKAPVERQPRGRSLDRAVPRQQGDWANRQRHLDYNSDSASESDSESSAPYTRPFSQSLRTTSFHDDLRALNRLPNVGGQLISLTQTDDSGGVDFSSFPNRRVYAQGDSMAPPARLSSSGITTTASTRRLLTNENAPPTKDPAKLPPSKLPARKPTGQAATAPVASRGSPLRPSSAQRTVASPAVAVSRMQPTSVLPKAGLPNGVSKNKLPPPAQKPLTPLGESHTPLRMSASKSGSAGAGATPKRPPTRQDDGLEMCNICGRSFLPDRIAKHQQICSKTSQKKRKTFDPVVARVKGTEAEQYLRKSKNAPEPKIKQSNWRRKHEDFIQTIRAAKQVQTHIASGGKLSDLPPPPPSDYSDYVPCPHCGRKFNQTAADRHIPKCASFQHNKPKPGAPSKSAGRGAAGGSSRR